ncbi:MAG TPA: hypothetical protein VIK50_09250 [Gemmatimonadaceae bacterium]
MTASRTTRFFIGAIMSLTLAGGAQAQIGGLIKKKVAEKVKGPEKTEVKPADGEKKSVYNDEIVEMTGPVLDGFMNGLRTEIALRNEFREVLAKLKTPAQYLACTNDAAASPEGQKISTRILSLPESVTAEEMQRVVTKASQDLVALQEKKCGKDPAVEWSDEKRAEKLKEIELKAAAAAGPVRPPSTDPDPAREDVDGGPFDTSVSSLPMEWALHVTGPVFEPQAIPSMPLLVYAMFKERVFMFCDAQIKGKIEIDSKGNVRFPGIGLGIYAVFSAAEASALKGRCDAIMQMLEKLNGVINEIRNMKQ